MCIQCIFPYFSFLVQKHQLEWVLASIQATILILYHFTFNQKYRNVPHDIYRNSQKYIYFKTWNLYCFSRLHFTRTIDPLFLLYDLICQILTKACCCSYHMWGANRNIIRMNSRMSSLDNEFTFFILCFHAFLFCLNRKINAERCVQRNIALKIIMHKFRYTVYDEL